MAKGYGYGEGLATAGRDRNGEGMAMAKGDRDGERITIPKSHGSAERDSDAEEWGYRNVGKR